MHVVESFDKKIEDFKASLTGLSDDEKHQKLQAFFENDLKSYQAQVKNEHIPAMKVREQEIDRLQKMLGENAMELPTLKEYLSPIFSELGKS